ncbi:MAG: hypothetical protein A2X49_09230 [Lentisphaerae bacterium GWF2_52_8]|nr:MAG: hypothetical protein A2X49_09230 [Lentisphaerae bacterium GWF2_52_8]
MQALGFENVRQLVAKQWSNQRVWHIIRLSLPAFAHRLAGKIGQTLTFMTNNWLWLEHNRT